VNLGGRAALSWRASSSSTCMGWLISRRPDGYHRPPALGHDRRQGSAMIDRSATLASTLPGSSLADSWDPGCHDGKWDAATSSTRADGAGDAIVRIMKTTTICGADRIDLECDGANCTPGHPGPRRSPRASSRLWRDERFPLEQDHRRPRPVRPSDRALPHPERGDAGADRARMVAADEKPPGRRAGSTEGSSLTGGGDRYLIPVTSESPRLAPP
jgi:hypothetical protein